MMPDPQRVKQELRAWLRQELVRLVNVQRVTFGQGTAVVSSPVREPELAALTWAGIVVHIHLLDEPVKPPRLRRMLESATNAGISTLFLVDTELLPIPGERVPPDRWYVALQALTREQIYAYQVGAHGPSIRPARFMPVNKHEVETHYAHEVPVAHLRHYRSSVRLNPLKGYWLVADFESERPFWQSPLRRTESQTHAGGSASSQPPPTGAAPDTPPARSRLDLAYELLGISRESSRDSVKAAFRKLAFDVHPDVSELPKEEAETKFKALNEAYETIRSAGGW